MPEEASEEGKEALTGTLYNQLVGSTLNLSLTSNVSIEASIVISQDGELLPYSHVVDNLPNEQFKKASISTSLMSTPATEGSNSITSSSGTQKLWLLNELEIDYAKTPKENADHLWEIKNSTNLSLISYFLGKKDLESQKIFEEYVKLFMFSGIALDDALRLFSKWFFLIGESQLLERALDIFSRRYHVENPEVFPSSDVVLLLSNALVILNTDLYNKNNKKKMSKKEFLKSIYLAIGPDTVPSSILKKFYRSIARKPILIPETPKESNRENGYSTQSFILGPSQTVSTSGSYTNSSDFSSRRSTLSSILGGFSAISSVQRNSASLRDYPSVCSNSSVSQVVYDIEYSGVIIRKRLFENRQIKARHRSWKHYYVVLQGSDLYFYPSFFTLAQHYSNTIKPLEKMSIRHAFFKAWSDRTGKRKNLVLLQQTNGIQQIFCYSSMDEMQNWLMKLNEMAALHSAPPLPLPTSGNNGDFIVPMVPTSVSSLTKEEQVLFIQRKINELEDYIHRLAIENPNLPSSVSTKVERTKSLGKKQSVQVDPKRFEIFQEKMNYFNWELQKYQIYAEAIHKRPHFLTLPTKPF